MNQVYEVKTFTGLDYLSKLFRFIENDSSLSHPLARVSLILIDSIKYD